jgi:site-specific DNA-cytosine methylase
LQGFPEDFKTYTVSDSVAEFHIGNAVPPPVILNILKAIIKTEVFDI